MSDGKSQLLAYVARIHPAQEFSPIDLEPGGAYALPGGLTLTSNPFGVSTEVDPDRLTLVGPFNTAVAVPTLDMFGGRVVIRGIDLLQAIARSVEVGPPVWSKRPDESGEWWKTQIAGCEPFAAPEPAPKTRPEMERHIEGCAACGPVSRAMALAIDAGSSAYRDADLAAMIEMAHGDQLAAIQFYERRQAGHSMLAMNAPDSPTKRHRTCLDSNETINQQTRRR